jgi:hypothetical protein
MPVMIVGDSSKCGGSTPNDPKAEGLYANAVPKAWGAVLLDEDLSILKLWHDPSSLGVGERVASDIVHMLGDVARSTDSALIPTDDGGITLEFVSERSGRDLLFAIPSDGSVRYFTARGPDGFRRAGIVKNDSAFGELARWLADSNADFSSLGLDVA